MGELQTFVYHDPSHGGASHSGTLHSGTSPAAQVGCWDDRVMAAAITLELYRLKGTHPDRHLSHGRKAKPWTRRLKPKDLDLAKRYPSY